MIQLKNIIRWMLILLHIDATKNLKYDRLTKKIIKTKLNSDSNTIDIGCHKGEILQMFKKHAPDGQHFGFEPIPELFQNLIVRFPKDHIFPYALSKEKGSLTFNHVIDAPAYSGLKERRYEIENPEINKIEVEVEKLDDVIPSDVQINFIKIDVEGAEYDVLLGAQEILKNYKPTLLFEFGLGASEFYNTKPEDLFTLLQKYNYRIFILENYVKAMSHMDLELFKAVYKANSEYYFVAE